MKKFEKFLDLTDFTALMVFLALILVPIILLMFNSCSSDDDATPQNQGEVYIPEKKSTISTPLNKSDEAKRLFSYIANCQASGATLSGQQDLTWDDSYDQLAKVYDAVGKYPAIMGFDFMNYTVSSGQSGQKQTEEALSFLNDGGIVAFCWHWRDPSSSTTEFDPTKMTFRIPYSSTSTSGLDESNDAFSKIKSDLDTIAAELLKIKSAGYPVLWRPLHEAYGNKDDWGGAWFWWGAGTGTTDGKGSNRKEAYLALYKYMHDYFTNEKGLDNLIWVWNAQNADWYPGDDYVDIVAYDNYKLEELSAQYEMLNSVAGGKKIIAISENGTIPSLSDLKNWAYFNTWNDHSSDASQSFWSSESHNTLAHRKEIYTSESVITRDELPDLKSYIINE